MKVQFRASIYTADGSFSPVLADLLPRRSLSSLSPTLTPQETIISFTITHVLQDSITPMRLVDVLGWKDTPLLSTVYLPLEAVLMEQLQLSLEDVEKFQNKRFYVNLYNITSVSKRSKFGILIPIVGKSLYHLVLIPNNEKFKKTCYNSLTNLQTLISSVPFNSVSLPLQQTYITSYKDYEELLTKISVPQGLKPIPLSSSGTPFSMAPPSSLPLLTSTSTLTDTNEILKDIDPLEFLKDRYANTLYNNTIPFEVFAKTALPRVHLLSRSNVKLVLTSLVDLLIFDVSQFDSFYKADTLISIITKNTSEDSNSTLYKFNKTSSESFKEYFTKNKVDLNSVCKLSELELQEDEKLNDLFQDLKAREARLQVLICLEVLSILTSNPEFEEVSKEANSTGKKTPTRPMSSSSNSLSKVSRPLIGRKRRLAPTLIGSSVPLGLSFTTDLRSEKSQASSSPVLASSPSFSSFPGSNLVPNSSSTSISTISQTPNKQKVKPVINTATVKDLLNSFFERICLYEAIKGIDYKSKKSGFNFILVSIIPYFQTRVSNRMIKELVLKAKGPSLNSKEDAKKKERRKQREREKEREGSHMGSPDSLSDNFNSQRSQLSDHSNSILEKESLTLSGLGLKKSTSNLDKKSFDMIRNTSFSVPTLQRHDSSQSLSLSLSQSQAQSQSVDEKSIFKREKRILKPHSFHHKRKEQEKKEEEYVTQIESTPAKKKSKLLIEESPVHTKSRTRLETIPGSAVREPTHMEAPTLARRNDTNEIIIDSSPLKFAGQDNETANKNLLSPMAIRTIDVQIPPMTPTPATKSKRPVEEVVFSSPIAMRIPLHSPMVEKSVANADKLEVVVSSPVKPTNLDVLVMRTPMANPGSAKKAGSASGSRVAKPGEFILPRSSPFFKYRNEVNNNYNEIDNDHDHDHDNDNDNDNDNNRDEQDSSQSSKRKLTFN